MSTIIIFLLGGFLLITDYTIQKSPPIHLDFKPKVEVKEEIIYFDRIEFEEDGLHTITRDSVVFYN